MLRMGADGWDPSLGHTEKYTSMYTLLYTGVYPLLYTSTYTLLYTQKNYYVIVVSDSEKARFSGRANSQLLSDGATQDDTLALSDRHGSDVVRQQSVDATIGQFCRDVVRRPSRGERERYARI